jgi:hypothetical protein
LASTGTVMPAPKYCAYDNNGDPLSGGLLEVFLAGTSTPATTYADVGLTTPNTNPIVLDAAGRATVFLAPGSYKFVQRTSLALGATIVWSQDNITSVAPFNVDLDVVGIAGEALPPGASVYLSTGAGGTTAGRFYLTDADDPLKSSAAFTVGMVPDGLNIGEAGNVRLLGQIQLAGPLTVGAAYFASTVAGQITTAPPTNSRFIGQANGIQSLIIGGVTAAAGGGGGGSYNYLQLQVFA